jgi:hypothetical protein
MVTASGLGPDWTLAKRADGVCLSAPADSLPAMWSTLLPYLLGAASAFIAQYLVQAYAVPLTDTRARREERWEKDVLDYGDLLTTSVRPGYQGIPGAVVRPDGGQRGVRP